MTDTTQNQGSTTQDKNTASTPTQTGAANPGSNEAKFTQADIDRIFSEKLERSEARDARIRAEVKAAILKDLGLSEDADIKATKTDIEEIRKRKESDMTEAQKAQAERDKAIEDKKILEQRIISIETERRNDKIASALTQAASALKANDTDDVLRYARDKHGEALSALVDESGSIDTKKLTALLDKIKAEKVHYFTAPVHTPGSQSNSNGRHMPANASDLAQASMDTKRHIKANF